MDQAATGERYRLVYLGELLPGFDIGATRRAFESAFAVDEQRLQRVFAGGPVVVQRSVDRATGMKALRRLATLGMACELQRISKPTDNRWAVAGPREDTEQPKRPPASVTPDTIAQVPLKRSRVYTPEQIADWFPGTAPGRSAGTGLTLKATASLLVMLAGLATCLVLALTATAGVAWLALFGLPPLSAMAGPGPGAALYGIALVVGIFTALLLVKPLVAAQQPPPVATALDPVRQRAIYRFVAEVARCAGSPEPVRIHIDNGQDVSAERCRAGSRRELVLHVGMPLLLNLSAHELAGLMARELTAWSKEPAMRLGRTITGINRWLWRRVHDDDLWDQRTTSMCNSSSSMVAALGGAFARGFSAVRKLLLKPLLSVNRRASRRVLHQLGLAQDSLQVRLCGTACFLRTLECQRELAAGAALAVQRFEDGWSKGKLVDNLPGLIVQLARQAEPGEHDAFSDPGPVPWQPGVSGADRQAAARSANAAGMLKHAGRARRLLYSRRELCRKVTFCWYRHRGLKFSDKHLVPLADFAASADGLGEGAEALGRLFGDAFSSDRVLTLPSITSLQAAEPGRLSTAAAGARQQWTAVAAEATAVVRRREALLHTLSNLRIARALVRGDVAIDAAEFNLPSDAPEAVDQQVGATIAELQAMERALGEFEKRQALYLAATLAFGCTQNVFRHAELSLSLNALNMLRQQAGSIVELEAMSHELTTLAALAGHARTQAVEQAVLDGTAKVVRMLASYRTSLRHIQNPLNIDRTLAQEIDQWAGDSDDIASDPVAAATAATAVARCLRHLNTGITSQLADLAERVNGMARERVANGYS